MLWNLNLLNLKEGCRIRFGGGKKKSFFVFYRVAFHGSSCAKSFCFFYNNDHLFLMPFTCELCRHTSVMVNECT